MEDDIRRSGDIPTGFGPGFASEIDGILQHSGPRENARAWARNLRFLTFDDGTDNVTNKKLPMSKSGQCQRCAQRVPLPSGHKCAIHANIRMTPKEINSWERKLQSYSNPCVHVEDLTCDGCSHIPLFPNTGDISTFRIRRAKVQSVDGTSVNCKHFVAVSYCWSSQDDDDSDGETKPEPYTVIEEDGTRRPMRAARKTIDRVVRFARENGFRMIWIDQECIEQDNPTEKELSIQSMDLVYQKAHTCIGLMNTKWEQRHLNALLLGSESNDSGEQEKNRRGLRPVRKGPVPSDEDFVVDLVEAVCELVYDKWNTRAWVLQEAFLAADRMLLLVPRIEPIDVNGWWFVCHERSLTELAVSLYMIQDALEYHVLPHFPRERLAAEKDSWLANLFDDIRFFYPRSIDTLSRLAIGDFWERKGCDAATALAFLKRRDLFRVADRIAILANICGYEKRLNTTELEKSGRNLSHCLLSLAIINGDLSLLVPEMYKVPSGQSIAFPSEHASEFSWVHSLTQGLHLLESATLTPSSNTAVAEVPRSYKLSSEGISLLGILWKVNEFIRLEPIRAKYSEGWGQVKKEGTSPDSRRKATTHIFFEIIMLLKAKGMIQVADAIFNSVSDPKFGVDNTKTSTQNVVESVLDIPHNKKMENRGGMFWFSWVIGGMPHQSWVIDRIMQSGGLWLAQPVDEGFLPFGQDKSSSRNSWWKRKPASRNTLINALRSHNLSALADDESGLDVPAVLKLLEDGTSQLAKQSHSDRLLQASFFAKLLPEIRERIPDSLMSINTEHLAEDNKGKARECSGPMVSVHDMVAMDFYSSRLAAQVDASEFLNRRALFDLGGSDAKGTLILTPFQACLESIPRPRAKGLSVSWIVEDSGRTSPKGNRKGERKFRAKGMVKGMWRHTFFHSGRFTLA